MDMYVINKTCARICVKNNMNISLIESTCTREKLKRSSRSKRNWSHQQWYSIHGYIIRKINTSQSPNEFVLVLNGRQLESLRYSSHREQSVAARSSASSVEYILLQAVWNGLLSRSPNLFTPIARLADSHPCKTQQYTPTDYTSIITLTTIKPQQSNHQAKSWWILQRIVEETCSEDHTKKVTC